MTWIQTLDGRKFDLFRPSAESIDPITLAKVLSRICRFGGHCKSFYSVAQHSVMVCDLVEEPELKLAALLHDAHEAYWGFGDVQRPAKQLFPEFRIHFNAHVLAIDEVIGKRFGMNYLDMHSPEVKHADNVALATEARDLMAPPAFPWDALPPPNDYIIKPWTMGNAYRIFAWRLNNLWT